MPNGPTVPLVRQVSVEQSDRVNLTEKKINRTQNASGGNLARRRLVLDKQNISAGVHQLDKNGFKPEIG